MTDLPEPLTPSDCDLRGMEWMPLYGDRLLSSETWLEAGPEGRCAALALWWASWKQCPAGSLADSDRVLCQIAGYGMAIKSWHAIKEEAMRGWVKCSDGRLYHPVVCELADEAYARRVKDRQRKEKWRNGKMGQNADGDGDKTGTEPFQDAELDVPETVLEQMTGQDRTGQEIKKERSSLRSPRARAANPDFDAFWRAYPRKVGKGAAAKAWVRATTLNPPSAIIAAVALQKFDHRERFIPHPATWLNQERWLDEQSNFDPVLRAAGLCEADYTDETPDWLKILGGSA